MSLQLNKESSVETIDRVAHRLGVTVTWLFDLTIEYGLEPEDGVIWVFRLDDEDGVIAFTPYGVENLKNIIAERRSRP